MPADGRALYDILLPGAPTPQEERAAGELAHWLGQMTGGAFAVRTEAAGRAEGPVISVGRTLRRTAAGLDTLEAGLGPEGYAVAVHGQDLYLAGGATRGPLYAALALLEEDLGCRWYTRDCTRIPSAPTLQAAIVPRRYSPQFAVRDPFSFVSNDPSWSLRNRTNAYGAPLPEEVGGNLDYVPGWFVHTYDRILPGTPENFAACPDCFMLDEDGTRSARQLCPTHPRVVERAIAAVQQALAAHPDADLIDVSQNDIRGYCHCPRCLALIEAEGTPAAPLLTLVNAVADAVAVSHPRVTVSTLGYQDTVPATRRLEPAGNVAIRLCTDVTWSDVFNPAANHPTFMAALAGWSRLARRIHIWEYQVNFGDYFQPWPSFHAKAENLRLFAQHNVRGVMEQGAYQGPGNERQEMRAWVFAKLLWDPSRDAWALMQDFVRGYYGPAAAPLEAYNRMLYDCGRRHQGVFDCMGAEAFVEAATALFDAAEQQAYAAGDAAAWERVERARLPVLDIELPLVRGRWVASQDSAALARYQALLARFAAAAHRAGVTQYSEGMHLESWLEQRRAFVAPPAGPEERTVQLDGGTVRLYRLPATWRLRRDPQDTGRQQAWFAAELDEAEWGSYRTDLKTGWEDQGFPGTDGVFWFRTRVALPAAVAGSRHTYLFFQACDEEAWVWLDGQPLGERTAASTGLDPSVLWLQPFALEVSGRLGPGEEHALAVRVRDNGGMGGLYMPVYVLGADMPLTTTQMGELLLDRNPYRR